MTEHRRIKGDPRLGFALSGDPEYDADTLETVRYAVEIARADIIAEIRAAIHKALQEQEKVNQAVREREGLGSDDEPALHFNSNDYEEYDGLVGRIEGLTIALKIVTGEEA